MSKKNFKDERFIGIEEEEKRNKIQLTQYYKKEYLRYLKLFCIILCYYISSYNFTQLELKLDIPIHKNNNQNFQNKKNDSKLKVALCTMAKYENLYSSEFLEYYINLGVDQIFIYDDNDPGIERISDTVKEQYKDKVTIYENIKGIIKHQSEAFTTCYKNNINKFDWFIMVDMDEYLYVINDTLKNYLSEKAFDKCDFIKINWVIAPDNDLLYYDSRPLFDRFKPPYVKDVFYKTIVKGGIPDMEYWVHSPKVSPTRNISCNDIGDIIASNEVNIEKSPNINVDKAFLIHFRFKSTEEFVQKYKRGYSDWFGDGLQDFLYTNIGHYFKQNKLTLEKINYLEKELKLSLYEYTIQYFIKSLFLF